MDSERPAPSSLLPAHHTSAHSPAPIPHTEPKELAILNFKDACRRIDEVAEVILPSVLCPHSDLSVQGARSWKVRARGGRC